MVALRKYQSGWLYLKLVKRQIAFLLSAFILSATTHVKAIDKYAVQNLLLKISSNEPDTQKSLDYGNLARHYKFSYPDSALYFANIAYKIALKNKFISGEAYAIKYMGEIYLEMNYPDTVPSFYYKAIQLFESIHNSLGIAETYFVLGSFHYQQGNYNECIDLYNKSVTIYLKLSPTRRIHYILNELGSLCYYQGLYKEAEKYYARALAYDIREKDTAMVATTLNNIALNFEKQGQNEKAYTYYKLAYKIGKITHFNDLITSVLANIGKLHINTRNYPMAEAALIKSLQYFDSSNTSYERIEIYEVLTDIYLKNKNLTKASSYLDSAAAVLLINPLPDLKKKLMSLYANYFEQKGDLFHALLCEKEIVTITDSIEKINKSKMVKATELRSILKSRESEIKKLSITNQEQQEQLKQGKISLIFLLIMALGITAITIILYVSYRSKSQINKKLEELNKERNTLMGMVSHDLKAPLASIHSLSELIESDGLNKLSEEQLVYNQYIRQIVDNSFEMINNVMDLSRVYDKNIQVNKTKVNLAVIIKTLIQSHRFQAAKKGITLIGENIDQNFEFILADQMHLKRIAENLISNAIKFSPPNGKVIISLHRIRDSLELHVKDDGPGISKTDQLNLFKKYQRLSASPTANESSNGLGLYIVKKLTELNGGKVWCESEPLSGATFKVSFPIN